jgi:hypothetical protein
LNLGGFATKAAELLKRVFHPLMLKVKKLWICDGRTGTPLKFAALQFAE